MTSPVLDLDAMRATAEAATPGAWRVAKPKGDGCILPEECVLLDNSKGWSDFIARAKPQDAAHIAAWSPANAIAVLDRLREAETERDARTDFMRREGYRSCDIPACNCNQWHGGHAARRFNEVRELVDEHGNFNGVTTLDAVRSFIARAEKAEARVAELEAKHDPA